MQALFVRLCVIFAAISSFGIITSVKFTPLRANITYRNEKYVTWGKVQVVRYGRRSNYYVNLEGFTKHTWANNVSVQVILMEWLHNEYKRSFVEGKFKFCDLLNLEVYAYIGKIFTDRIACPLPAGEYHLMNLTTPKYVMEHFPYKFPMERARGDVFISITETGERISEGNVEVTIQNT